MALKKQFDWDNLTWPDFQRCCLHLAQNFFPDSSFEEYLQPGNKQAGIDLLTVQQPQGKLITIQCKKVQKLTVADAKKIISEFEKEYFSTRASKFILATSAILDGKVIAYWQQESERWKKDYQVELQRWDRNFLEAQLERHYNLVVFYFDEATAEERCHQPAIKIETHPIAPTAGFIPRNIHRHQGGLTMEQRRYYAFKTETTTLTDLITTDRFKPKNICLIADAYQGKSFLLRQTYWELQKNKLPFTPILLECKNQTNQPIAKMLQENVEQWKSIPAKDLVIFIDGMDEVPGDKFLDMLAHIRAFRKSRPYITLVFSCRRIFYEHYEIAKELPEFETYELCPLGHHGIDAFIKSRLPGNYVQFKKIVSTTGLSYFLYHPFFLTTLVDIYNDTPAKMPTSKAQVLEQFIERSFYQQRARKINGGMTMRDKKVMYKKTIQQLALALQLSGLNAFSDEDLQTLFSMEEIELLRINTLVSKHNGYWSFTNALFQEHLAALMLLDKPYEQIEPLISVGQKIKKVKTKWIEATSSLLSLLEPSSDTYQKLITFVEQDNIELLFTTERSKFDSFLRCTLLKKLFDRCIAHHIRPMLIEEEKIAQFIEGDAASVQFLVEIAFKRDLPQIVRQSAIRVLQTLNSLLQYKQIFFDCAVKEMKTTNEWLVASALIETLTAFRLGDRSVAEHVMSRKAFCEVHSYRSAIYDYLITMRWVDHYYSFGLEGLPHLVETNRLVFHAGSEYKFEEFLLATENAANLKHLIFQLGEDKWTEYADEHSVSFSQLCQRVVIKAIQMYEADPTIALAITALIVKLDRKYLTDDYYAIDDFFLQTGTYDLAVRASIDQLMSDTTWGLAGLIRESSFDYLLAEWEHNDKASMGILRNWLGKLRYKKLPDAAPLYSLLMELTEGKLYEDESTSYQEYEATEKQKRANDLKYIRDQESFKKGVQAFFQAYGNGEIGEDELYVHIDSSLRRRNTDSNFVYHFLLRWVRDNKVASLSKALKIIDDSERFEYFRAREILHYQFIHTPEEEVMIGYVREFFLKNLPQLELVNSYKETTYYPHHVLFGELFEKFLFQAPAAHLMRLVWLDTGGIRGFENSKANTKTSLSEKIISLLSPAEQNEFAQTILNNLKLGIQHSSVLGTHLQLCKHFKLREAVEIIEGLIIKDSGVHVSKADMLDIYLYLGGSIEGLLPYFEQMKTYGYDYFHFVKTFINLFPTQVHQSLTQCMQASDLSTEWKVSAAKYCCWLGDSEGFRFLAESMHQNLIAPYSIQSFTQVANVDTATALEIMQDLQPLFFAANKASHFSESPKDMMIEWLSHFAMKSEADLYLVLAFYDDAFAKLHTTYAEAHNLYWYQERVVEKFRDSDKTTYSITQVKQTLLTKFS